MNILYLTMAPIDESSGVYKKIRAQVDAFKRLGHTCKLLFVRDTEEAYYYPHKEQEILNLNNEFHIRYISDYLSTCDFCYARFELLRHKYYKKIIDECKIKKVKVVTEIPTFPPYQESMARVKEDFRNKKYLRALKTFMGTAFVVLDMYRMTLYSKLVVIIADNKKFRFADTVRIENGIDLDKNPYQRKIVNDEKVRIIAVSNFSVWNGYDRAIAGLKQYVDTTANPNVELIMVGGIKEGQSLIQQTEEMGLNDYVTFTGALSGKALDSAYASADIALGALGNHRRKVFANSSLKAKEYASRGMLMVLSDAEGIESEIRDISFVVKSDESPLDFEAILKWFDSIPLKEDTKYNIHKFAKNNYSWDAQLVKVLKTLNDNE